jgi:hypothetical protein
LHLSSQPDPLVVGDTLAVQIQTNQPGYLYIYQVATDGETLSLVFPNAMDAANYLPAGMTALPRPSWQLRAHGPVGTGYLLAVLTPQAQNLLTLQGEVNAGYIKPPQPYAAALLPLREIATSR